MTHRQLSRNGRSSRAVPTRTLLSEDYYLPHFMLNKPGMQPSDEMPEEDRLHAEYVWKMLVDLTKICVQKLQELNVSKQYANRPLEWFGYMDLLVTSTHWANFKALRSDASAAMREIYDLEAAITDSLNHSTPVLLRPGEWHLPYVTDDEKTIHSLDIQKKLSAKRCARISYRPFDGNADLQKELEGYNKLIESKPVHATPVEHQATPDRWISSIEAWEQPDLHGNFTGWIQNRKLIESEYVPDDFEAKYRKRYVNGK